VEAGAGILFPTDYPCTVIAMGSVNRIAYGRDWRKSEKYCGVLSLYSSVLMRSLHSLTSGTPFPCVPREF